MKEVARDLGDANVDSGGVNEHLSELNIQRAALDNRVARLARAQASNAKEAG